jgi:type I restriction-modification system DNA methylase subunit
MPFASTLGHEIANLDAALVPGVTDIVLDRWSGEYGAIPRPVRSLIAGLAAPTGVLYQPDCGTAQLLVQAALTSSALDRVLADEPDPQWAAVASTNLAIHDINGQVRCRTKYDDEQFAYLEGDVFPDLRADCVVAGPPSTDIMPGNVAGDPRWIWGEPAPSDRSFAWVQHCLYHLADTGRAVITVPANSLSSGGNSGRIRQRIVKAGLLDAVVTLPAGSLTHSSARWAVLVLSKAPGHPKETLMVDLSEPARGAPRPGLLKPDTIEQTVRTYHDWTADRRPAMPKSTVATFDQMAENDFNIHPARYQSVEDDTASTQKIPSAAALRSHLATLIEASRTADDRVIDLLRAGK